jgi:hypothetical protein
MNAVTIWDEMTSTLGQPQLAITLAVAEAHLTLRELIRARVYQEVAANNAQQGEYFHGLVQPTGAERALNGYRLRQSRQIDWEQQYTRALETFEHNGFVVLVDDHQVDDLDAAIEMRPDLSVHFLKLVPLVGG